MHLIQSIAPPVSESNCDRERLSALAKKSLGPVCLCDRGGHHGVLVWYHGDPMGWTRYEQLARHIDVNCTGETEDPWELPLRTNTTTNPITKTSTIPKGRTKPSISRYDLNTDSIKRQKAEPLTKSVTKSLLKLTTHTTYSKQTRPHTDTNNRLYIFCVLIEKNTNDV